MKKRQSIVKEKLNPFELKMKEKKEAEESAKNL